MAEDDESGFHIQRTWAIEYQARKRQVWAPSQPLRKHMGSLTKPSPTNKREHDLHSVPTCRLTDRSKRVGREMPVGGGGQLTQACSRPAACCWRRWGPRWLTRAPSCPEVRRGERILSHATVLTLPCEPSRKTVQSDSQHHKGPARARDCHRLHIALGKGGGTVTGGVVNALHCTPAAAGSRPSP